VIAGISFVPATLLILVLVTVVVVRSRPTVTKIACEVALLALIGGVLVARGTSPLTIDDGLMQAPDAPWLRAIAVVWWLIGARLVATLTVLGLGRDARSRQARLFSDLLAGGIYLTAILIILNSVLNLPIKGLLATSGVIAIVLGLALQNTLADVFSGIAVGLEQPFHVGDRITIADHAEGIVVEMNWRSIRIQTDGEDVATIPNSIVARSQIINRSVPTERRAASIEIPTLSSARSEHLMELVRQAILLCPAHLDPDDDHRRHLFRVVHAVAEPGP
jgi:small-conductance mechanosensitive channel